MARARVRWILGPTSLLPVLAMCLELPVALGQGRPSPRTYLNRLTPIDRPGVLLGDHPEFVEPIRETARFEAPILVDDEDADLEVRAWRFSYNARGIVEVPNRLSGKRTAIVVVHPWGIDDGQGWKTPEPAGVAFQCTPVKNRIVLEHAAKVIEPLLERLRPHLGLVAYSLPGKEDPVRARVYRSVRGRPKSEELEEARRSLHSELGAFDYRGGELPDRIEVSSATPTVDYFRAFPGLDAQAPFDPKGFWELPIPVTSAITVARDDVVFYDAEGYPLLRDYLESEGITHVLLAGYNTDMCVCSTTAGYENLRKDFDVFLVGDATVATFPGNPSPRFATNAAVSFAALDLFITQTSWIRPISRGK